MLQAGPNLRMAACLKAAHSGKTAREMVPQTSIVQQFVSMGILYVRELNVKSNGVYVYLEV